MIRRMGGIASVFEVRCEPLGNKSFPAFRDLMDVYVDLCAAALKNEKDFLDEGISLDDDEAARERLNAAFEAIFGVPPGS